MIFRYFLVSAGVCCASISACAQGVVLQGTLSQTRGDATLSAKIWAQAPDKLRVETDEATLISSGDTTQIFDKTTRRLRVFRWGLGAHWTRGATLAMGGPANFALVGQTAKTETQSVRDESAIRLVRDTALFGGGGKNAFYAARKTPVAKFPVRVDWSRTVRAEFDTQNREIARYTLEFSGDLPRAATSGATRWNYELKPAETAPDATLWTIPEAASAVPEAAEVGAPALYRADPFNRAMALWQNAGDLRGALELLRQARDQNPNATAPLLARFEIEMALRDEASAEKTVAALEDLGLGAMTTQMLRARVLAARRDFAGAQRAAQNALKAAPQNPQTQLFAAFAARQNGDLPEFRRLAIQILASPSAEASARAATAIALVSSAAPSEFEDLRTALAGEAEPLRLARALVTLRASTASANTENQNISGWSLPEYAAEWAFGLTRAGRDSEAKMAWEMLLASPNLERAMRNRAQMFLMGLAARRGDISASIAALRALEWNLESQKDAAKSAFFESWQKSFRRLTLEKTLENRAGATRAGEDDAQLWVAYSASYKTPEERERALEAAFARFNSPGFGARIAEIAVGKASSLMVADPVERAARERFYSRALANLESAIRAEPKQPFFQIQKTLVLAHRYARLGASDAGQAIAERDAARREVEALLAAFPDDADAKISAAVALLTFDRTQGATRAQTLAREALENSGADGERTTFVFAARQTIASASERLGQFDEAAEQFEILLDGANTASDTAQLAGAYFDLLDRRGAAAQGKANNQAGENVTPDGVPTEGALGDGPHVARMARIGAGLVARNWPFEDAKLLTDALARRLLLSPSRVAVTRAVRNFGGEGAMLLWATMAHYRLESARNILSNPDAPPAADAELERATRELSAAVSALTPLASNEGNPQMAARAAAFLAERGNLSPEDGARFLRRAAALEPQDLALQLSQLEALGAAEQNARTSAELRAQIAAKFDFSPESARQMALVAWSQNDDALAKLLSEESFQLSTFSPEVGANGFQRAAFSLAKILATTQNLARANEIYGNLALEQWGQIDRAAALLAQRQRAVESGGDGKIYDDRIRALGLDLETLEAAADWMVSVEN